MSRWPSYAIVALSCFTVGTATEFVKDRLRKRRERERRKAALYVVLETNLQSLLNSHASAESGALPPSVSDPLREMTPLRARITPGDEAR